MDDAHPGTTLWEPLSYRINKTMFSNLLFDHFFPSVYKIPWTEEPGRLQSMGSLRVRHDWATSLSSLSCIGEGNGNPLQYSCLENPRDRGAWWAAIYGVAQSRTQLKRLSSCIYAANSGLQNECWWFFLHIELKPRNYVSSYADCQSW